MSRTLQLLIGAIILIAVIAGIGVIWKYTQLTQDPWTEQEAWIFLHKGESAESLMTQLKATGGDTESGAFALGCKLFGLEKSLENGVSGAFHMKAGMSAADVIRKITHRQQDPVKLTFIGTRTLPELAGRLAQEVEADSVTLLQAMYDEEFLSACECDRANVSAIFLPDTYEVYWTISPQKLMQKMLSEYKKYWNDERRRLASDLRLTPLQVSTICSIAEEETADRQERSVVARLYWNRLQKGMLLQADPTVKYAVGDFQLRRILKRHLKAQSPYNTYLNKGLPPGPIRVVEKATIDGFLHSQTHAYLYMCAKEDFSGRHNFATTLREHNRNATLYHKALKKNRIY